MNLFDMFDFDDDGLLDKKEFEAYSLMSGSGPVNSEVIPTQMIQLNYTYIEALI